MFQVNNFAKNGPNPRITSIHFCLLIKTERNGSIFGFLQDQLSYRKQSFSKANEIVAQTFSHSPTFERNVWSRQTLVIRNG